MMRPVKRKCVCVGETSDLGTFQGQEPSISGSLIPATLVLIRLARKKSGKKGKGKKGKGKKKKKVGLRTGKVARPLELQDVFVLVP